MHGLIDTLFHLLPIGDRSFYERSLFLIPLFPFIGFLLNGLFGSKFSKKESSWIGILGAFAAFTWAFLCVATLNVGTGAKEGMSASLSEDTRNALHVVYGTWIHVGDFSCSFGMLLDPLSSVMIMIVTGIGTLIHIYSAGYMAHDEGLARFFAYLNLFLFAMILLVLGDNLIVLFVGWEGVGLCSYLLIGFWYEDSKNAAAGMKAFVVNRIGDLGFLLGIFTLIAVFGTVNFVASPKRVGVHHVTKQTCLEQEKVEVPRGAGLLDYAEALRLLRKNGNITEERASAPLGFKAPENISNLDLSHTMGSKIFTEWSIGMALTLACALLFVGAMGKSAQIPLYVWLPDAMAGPTPVSALIHAATMVTAGVYMVCRLHSIFSLSEEVLRMVAIVGGCTSLFSALIGLTQLDIKKVLAYSTVSQLGYMFLGLGVGAFSLGIFHVLTHAFFKALLFLGAGSVIHAMSGEQDMRYMGGLRSKLPKTFWTMVIGGVALAGVPGFAGWWSKDEILAETLLRYGDSHQTIYLVLYIFAAVGAFCTAFYTCRLICLTFLGENRAKDEVKAHIHESPPSMTIPLIVLAAFSVVGGVIWHVAFTAGAESQLGIRNIEAVVSAEEHHHIHLINTAATLMAAFGGIGLAFFRYGKGKNIPDPERAKTNIFYRLSLNKFYVDETYNALIIMPFTIISELTHWVVDVGIIDSIVVRGTAKMVSAFSGQLRRVQTGLLNSYASFMMYGAAGVLFYLLAKAYLIK